MPESGKPYPENPSLGNQAPSRPREVELGRIALAPHEVKPRNLKILREGVEINEITPTEHEVMILVAKGLTNKQIAQERVVSEQTAKFHVGKLLQKLQVRRRDDIAKIYGDFIGNSIDSDTLEKITELTEKQMQIFLLLADNPTTSELAETLVVSGETVKFHLDRIYSVLDVSSRLNASILARGYISFLNSSNQSHADLASEPVIDENIKTNEIMQPVEPSGRRARARPSAYKRGTKIA